MDSTISRENGDKSKGFRFQKLRACIRLLEKLTQGGANRISCAIELLEDSFLVDENDQPAIAIEENKLYTSALTFNSSPVRNTVVAFLDLSFRYLHDPTISFWFFASATVGNERPSEATLTALGIKDLGSCSILKKLISKSPLSEEEVKICHRLVIDEYKSQYAKKASSYLSAIETWSPSTMLEFIQRIEWTITDECNDELEERALEKVRICPLFTSRHESLEKFILAAIGDLFEKLSERDGATAKLVHAADIALIYEQVLGVREQGKPHDPAHKTWNEIDIEDVRNLEEKIKAVAPRYLPKAIKTLQRRCALAKMEAETFGREYVSLRRRLFDVCEAVLAEKLTNVKEIDQSYIEEILNEMNKRSIEHLAEIGKSYSYRIQDNETIKGAILSLFDECYIAFDESV